MFKVSSQDVYNLKQLQEEMQQPTNPTLTEPLSIDHIASLNLPEQAKITLVERCLEAKVADWNFFRSSSLTELKECIPGVAPAQLLVAKRFFESLPAHNDDTPDAAQNNINNNNQPMHPPNNNNMNLQRNNAAAPNVNAFEVLLGRTKVDPQRVKYIQQQQRPIRSKYRIADCTWPCWSVL